MMTPVTPNGDAANKRNAADKRSANGHCRDVCRSLPRRVEGTSIPGIELPLSRSRNSALATSTERQTSRTCQALLSQPEIA